MREVKHAESEAEFVHKMSLSLMETNETLYWLLLRRFGGYSEKASFQSIRSDNLELIKLLADIVETAKARKHLA